MGELTYKKINRSHTHTDRQRTLRMQYIYIYINWGETSTAWPLIYVSAHGYAYIWMQYILLLMYFVNMSDAFFFSAVIFLAKRTGEKRALHGRSYTYPRMGVLVYECNKFIHWYIFLFNDRFWFFWSGITFLDKKTGETRILHRRWFTYRRMGAPSYENINSSHTHTHRQRTTTMQYIYIYINCGETSTSWPLIYVSTHGWDDI